MVVLGVLAAGACVFALLLAVTTALGERQRGGSWAVAVLAGLLFPLTWVGWYVLDRQAPPAADGA